MYYYDQNGLSWECKVNSRIFINETSHIKGEKPDAEKAFNKI